jgi:hypothetical protein
MERRTQDEGFRDQRHEVPPSVEAYQQPARYGDGNDDRATQPPIGLRVRWGGVTSGWLIALGTILLLTALGLAIGITAIGDPRAADRETASGLGIGAGLWGAVTLLIAYFLGGLMADPGDGPSGPWRSSHAWGARLDADLGVSDLAARPRD